MAGFFYDIDSESFTHQDDYFSRYPQDMAIGLGVTFRLISLCHHYLCV